MLVTEVTEMAISATRVCQRLFPCIQTFLWFLQQEISYEGKGSTADTKEFVETAYALVLEGFTT